MHRHRIALAAALASLALAGCGDSEDTESASTPKASQTTEAKPEEPSKRSQMLDCLDDISKVGRFEGGQFIEDKAFDGPYTLMTSGLSPKHIAVVLVHSTVAEAKASVAEGPADGFDSLAIGRAEYVKNDDDRTRNMIIVQCINAQYG